MKKPPYKVYKRKEKEKTPVHIPERIDTPQAEQLVSDFYKLLNFISKHRAKLLGILAFLFIIGGSYLGYSFYERSVELKAAELVDKGLYYLDNGNEKEAVSYFGKAVKEYRGAPSARLAQFLLGKIEKKEDELKPLASSNSYLLAPPSKTALITWGIDKGKVPPYQVKRNEWTHPEYLYDRLLFALKEGKVKEAEDIYNALSGDYGSLPISSLAGRLVE
ncbi:hypothetical protein [Thermovibrio sp.]